MPRDSAFISYSRLDAAWMKRLRTQLAPLEEAGRLRVGWLARPTSWPPGRWGPAGT